MKTPVKQLRNTFIVDMLAHYTENKRGLTEDGRCTYTAGCAIGRLCSKELCEYFQGRHNPSVQNKDVFQKLPKELQALGSNFLQSIQELHDYNGYWMVFNGKNILTYLGENKLNFIKKTFRL